MKKMYISFTEEKPATLEIRHWITLNATSCRWRLGDRDLDNEIWYQRRKIIGVHLHLSAEDATAFKLKFQL